MFVNRFGAAVIGLTAACVLVGCAADAGDAAEGGGGESESTLSIGYMTGVQGDGFFATTVCGAEAAAEEYGVDLDVQVPPEFSVQSSTPVLQALVTRGIDGLIAYPVDPVGVTPVLKEAQESGVKVYTLSADIDDTSARSKNIGQNLFDGGVVAGKNLGEALGGTGKVFVVSVAPDLGPAVDRTNGFVEGISEFPDIEYVGVQYSNNDEATAAQVTTAQLLADPDITGIYAVNHQSGVGAVNAVKQAGLIGTVKVVMHDTDAAQVEALERGDVIGLIGTNAFQFGYQAVKVMAEEFAGNDVEAVIPDEAYITLDNLNDEVIQREHIYRTEC